MNMHGMPQQGIGPGVGMPGVGVSPGMMQQQPSPQQLQMGQVMVPQNPQQVMQQSQAQAEKIDNISKVKSLIGPLRDSLSATIRTAAQSLQHNNMTDVGPIKGVDNKNVPPRFDKNLEEFYSICDQIELHLKTSIQCIQQSTSSQHYLPFPVASTRMEPIQQTDTGHLSLSYPQYLSTVRAQIGFAKEIHDTLICAAQNISPTE